MSRAQLAAIVFGSHEYHAEVVDDVYLHLLSRAAETSGSAYWAGQLDGGITDEQLVALIASS